ncbi:MAG: YceI family protein [Phycisphaerales bacterium]
MRNVERLIVTGLAAGAALLSPLAAHAAERTESGKTLVIPSEHASQGQPYYVHNGLDAQVTFISDAPLEHIKGTSNKVVGYAVRSTGDGLALGAGEFALPVASLDTGIPLRNEHLQGERWMNAPTHPDVLFVLKSTKDANEVKKSDTFTTYAVTLVGTMTVKGTSREMEIPARITLMPANDQTKVRAPGDLMAIRATYDIKMSDFGIGVDDPGIKIGKLSDTLTMDTFLLLSTVSPDDVRRR